MKWNILTIFKRFFFKDNYKLKTERSFEELKKIEKEREFCSNKGKN